MCFATCVLGCFKTKTLGYRGNQNLKASISRTLGKAFQNDRSSTVLMNWWLENIQQNSRWKLEFQASRCQSLRCLWVAMTPKDWLHFLNLYFQKHLTGLTAFVLQITTQNLRTPRNRMAKSQSTPRQSTLAMNFWWSPLFRTWMTAAWRITCALVSSHRLPQVASLSNEFWLFIPLTNWKEVFHCFNSHNTSFCDEDLKL